MKRTRSAGQSILEVLFATAVVALVLVAILSTIIASLRNARSSMEQSQTTSYANEVLEWLRRERDQQGWVVFSESGPGVGNTVVYCLDVLPASIQALSSKSGVCGSTTIPDSAFIRQLSLQRLSDEEIEASITVTRPSRAGTTETLLKGRFTKWQ